MPTQLPAALSSLQPREAHSPLGQMLLTLWRTSRSASSEHGMLTYDMVPVVIEGLLAQAALHPFDPAERLAVGQGGSSEWKSLLDVVLALGGPVQRGPQHCAWPLELEGFDEALLRREKGGRLDNEWAAAVLTAAGCNPWDSLRQEPDRLPEEVRLAMEKGYAGLVMRFLACPGAWTIDRLMGRRETMTKLLNQPHAAPVLKALLENGGQLKHPEELASACPPAILAVAQTGQVHLPEALGAAVRAHWKTRNDLTPQAIGSLTQALWPERQDEAVALEIGKWLGVGWAQGNGVTPALRLNPDEAVWVQRARQKAGPAAGAWSVLAAAVWAQTKQTANRGAPWWGIVTKDAHGSLADGLGFDWQPGVAIDGVVALGLMSQGGEASAAQPQNQERIQSFARAAGLGDPNAWAARHAGAAARFTAHVLKRAPSGRGVLARAWAFALAQCPPMAQGLSDEDTLALLDGLGLRRPSERSEAGAFFTAIVHRLRPQWDIAGGRVLDLPPGDNRVALAVCRMSAALVGALALVDELVASPPERDPKLVERVEAWIAENEPDRGRADEAVGRLRAWHLAAQLDPPGPARSRGPRL